MMVQRKKQKKCRQRRYYDGRCEDFERERHGGGATRFTFRIECKYIQIFSNLKGEFQCTMASDADAKKQHSTPQSQHDA